MEQIRSSSAGEVGNSETLTIQGSNVNINFLAGVHGCNAAQVRDSTFLPGP